MTSTASVADYLRIMADHPGATRVSFDNVMLRAAADRLHKLETNLAAMQIQRDALQTILADRAAQPVDDRRTGPGRPGPRPAPSQHPAAHRNLTRLLKARLIVADDTHPQHLQLVNAIDTALELDPKPHLVAGATERAHDDTRGGEARLPDPEEISGEAMPLTSAKLRIEIDTIRPFTPGYAANFVHLKAAEDTQP